jgi:hypothetical protein
MSAGGFLTTIHSMMEVAAASAYLKEYQHCHILEIQRDKPCKNILSVIVSQVDLRRSSDRDTPGLAIPRSEQICFYQAVRSANLM